MLSVQTYKGHLYHPPPRLSKDHQQKNVRARRWEGDCKPGSDDSYWGLPAQDWSHQDSITDRGEAH